MYCTLCSSQSVRWYGVTYSFTKYDLYLVYDRAFSVKSDWDQNIPIPSSLIILLLFCEPLPLVWKYNNYIKMMHWNSAGVVFIIITVTVIDQFIVLTTGISEPNINNFSLIISIPLMQWLYWITRYEHEERRRYSKCCSSCYECSQ